MPPLPSSSSSSSLLFLLLLLLLLFLLGAGVWSYELAEDQQDVFARRACPAFLTFTNDAFLSGVTVELPCHCKPPEVQSVVWFFTEHLGGSGGTRALTDHHGNRLLDSSKVPHSAGLQSRFSIRLFSLLIFRASPRDAGVYVCGSAHNDFFYAYDLDIQEAAEVRFTPRSTQSRASSSSSSSRVRTGRGRFQLFSGLRSWSVCDRCGAPGEQVRVGLCYVRSDFLHVRYRRANQTVASCGSAAVPRAFGLHRNSRAKMEVRSCQVDCPAEAPPPTRLLGLMTFLGYSSSSVPVFYLQHAADRVLTMGCPRALPHMAVAWDRGSEPIYRSQHLAGGNSSSTDPRVLIDTGHHLVFKPAISQDSGVYYCWLQGRRAAEIRLLVYVHLGRGESVTSHPEFRTAVTTVLKSYAAMTTAFCLLLLARAAVRLLRDRATTHLD